MEAAALYIFGLALFDCLSISMRSHDLYVPVLDEGRRGADTAAIVRYW